MARLIETMRNRVREIGTCAIVGEVGLDGWQRRLAVHRGPGQYDFLDEAASEVNVGDIWARQGHTAFLSRAVTIPAEWAGMKVAIELVTGGEGLLSVDGTPYHGVDDRRGFILLRRKCSGGETLNLDIEMKTGGYLEFVAHDERKPYILSVARLVAADAEMEAAYHDFRVAVECAGAVADPVVAEGILLAVKGALECVDFRNAGRLSAEQLASARRDLSERLAAIGYGRLSGSIFFAGHSHIDVAWLWPLRETMRKVGRTYATVTALMDEFPEYHFVCSQVPLFLYLKEHFPSVYERVKAYVAEGRFEPIGGTWVEHDTNVPSGESMVRQCLYGKQFFRDEFGVDVRVGWLPDVFGYTWSLPQIYRRAGLDGFMTAKVAWNETNRIPHNTFWWEGIDGTRILAHLVHNLGPMYNAHVRPDEILKQWSDYADKLRFPDMLCPFGYGDGGGGPTREMLETIPRLAAMPGMPAARTGRVHDFFDRLRESADGAPVWNGEMYFERHRGTYTTQAANKRDNRRAELLLRDAEMFSVVAEILGKQYPAERIRSAWHTVLLNQFHDILPGSSIRAVYEDTAADYRAVLGSAEQVREETMQHVEGFINTDGDGVPIVVYNTLSWQRDGLVTVDAPKGKSRFTVWDPSGRAMPVHVEGGRLTFLAERVPACGYAVFRCVAGSTESPRCHLRYDRGRAHGPWYDIVFDEQGGIAGIVDLVHHRQVLRPGSRGNVLQVFEDKPVHDEAWDIDLSYQERSWEFVADGPPVQVECNALRMVLEQSLRYGRSTIDQRIILYCHDPRIDFVTRVNWQERKTMLKVAFPVNVHSPRATYEIAYGAIERPTHRSTSWDQARFEVPGHRWADLSEGDYGVAVLNDSKYGWDVEGDTIRLTLLRSPESPDPEADRGVHEFTYSLLPHRGDWRERVVFAGMELNTPLLPQVAKPHAGRLPKLRSTISVDRPNVIIDAVKMAEDGQGVVVRVYEAHGSRGPVKLTFTRPIAHAEECDLLEQRCADVDIKGFHIAFDILPWQVRTFRICLGESVTASAVVRASGSAG